MTNLSIHLIDKVEGKRRACVQTEDLDVGVRSQHRRVEADDVSQAGDQDAHLEYFENCYEKATRKYHHQFTAYPRL